MINISTISVIYTDSLDAVIKLGLVAYSLAFLRQFGVCVIGSFWAFTP